jgi:hypothetical protein
MTAVPPHEPGTAWPAHAAQPTGGPPMEDCQLSRRCTLADLGPDVLVASPR